MSIRVLIAEAHEGLRAALRTLLSAEPDIEVVGEAAFADAVLWLASRCDPSVILLDICLPGLGGFEAVHRLTQALPGVDILLLTDYADPALVRDALAAGASGCVAIQAAGSLLADAVRVASEDQLYIRPDMVRPLLTDLLQQTTFREERAKELTAGEAELLRLIARGYTRNQIAGELGITVRAVVSHRETIMHKLGLRSAVDLIRYATALRSIDTSA